MLSVFSFRFTKSAAYLSITLSLGLNSLEINWGRQCRCRLMDLTMTSSTSSFSGMCRESRTSSRQTSMPMGLGTESRGTRCGSIRHRISILTPSSGTATVSCKLLLPPSPFCSFFKNKLIKYKYSVKQFKLGSSTRFLVVDGIPIRAFLNKEVNGIPYPKSQPMEVRASVWNADDWATQGGRVKTNWSHAPFVSTFRFEPYIFNSSVRIYIIYCDI